MSVYARRGLIIRVMMLGLALLCWLFTGFGRLRASRVITLCYHGVTEAQRSSFRRQMASIARRVTLDLRARRSRRPAFAPPRVCITFDDAFANLLNHALPVTGALDIPVMIFVPTSCLGAFPSWPMASDHPDESQPIISQAQLERLAGDRFCRFGSHSMTHRALPDLALPEARRELVESRARLEQTIGRFVTDFAFPYGACDRGLIDEAKAAGYERIFTLDHPPGQVMRDASVIPRLRMSPDAWFIEFRLTVCGAYDWLPAARRLLGRLNLRTMRSPHRHRATPADPRLTGTPSGVRQPTT